MSVTLAKPSDRMQQLWLPTCFQQISICLQLANTSLSAKSNCAVHGHGASGNCQGADCVLAVLQMYTSPAGLKSPRQQAAEQQVPTTHDLGLDKQLPWNEK
jgi:hypothetical protein